MAEDWKKKYIDVVEKLKDLHSKWTSAQNPAAKEIEETFPELNISRDEKIRYALINQFREYQKRGENHGFEYSNEDILEWLEKNDEQNSAKWSDEVYKKINYLLNFYSGVAIREGRFDDAKLIDEVIKKLASFRSNRKQVTTNFSVGDIIKRKDSAVKYEVTRIADGEFQLDGGHWLDIRKMSEFELVK